MGQARIRVLVVDDDPDVRALLGDMLARRGYEPVVAEDGAQAIELLEGGERPAAILADLVMPGIIGNELVEYLASDDDLAQIPVAIVTGSPHLAPPGYPVFTKPAPIAELVAFLRECCPPRRARGDEDDLQPVVD